ncbi:MRNA capping enzyme [Ceratobasidium theobromae]|uniref:mRNA capping enzyme n=1 Tax=Ceratobasidium theobromae TaxID=1582974 RepID=A0A5N5QXR3_9AGAM|nr:MRNA capping enzyme [Ceratobasidium theobromae]
MRRLRLALLAALLCVALVALCLLALVLSGSGRTCARAALDLHVCRRHLNAPTPQRPQLLHELEVEFVNAGELLRQRGKRAQLGAGANPFDNLVRVFVNNVRIMVRNSA